MAQNISSIVHFQDLHIMISFIKKNSDIFGKSFQQNSLFYDIIIYASPENELIRIIKKMFVIIKEKNSFFQGDEHFFHIIKKRVSPQKQNKVENIQGIFLASYFFFLYIKSQQIQFLFWKKYNFENVQKIVGSITNFGLF